METISFTLKLTFTFPVHILSGSSILDFTRKNIYQRIEALTHIMV